MVVYKLGVIHFRLEFAGVEMLTTFWFLWHNFGSRYARMPIKGSKHSNDGLVSKKNLGQKIGLFVWRLEPGKVGHKIAKTLPLVTPPQENSKQKLKKFFQSKREDLLNP